MNVDIANRLVELRKVNNLSQEELADKLGISRQAISKWERAESSPDTDNLINLSRLYGVSLDALLATDSEIPRPKKAEDIEELEATLKEKFQELKVKLEPVRKQAIAVSRRVFGIYLIMALVAVTAHIIMGFAGDLWHPGWIIYLAIPLAISAYEGVIIIKRKKCVLCGLLVFCYPVLVLAIYLAVCFSVGLWHPLWLMFLTIPVYYTIIINLLKKARKASAE